ncbi:hypothetical protein [Rhizobium halophilum]|nr:hypothetical protein [Rhizobium halophilum]
MLRSDVALPDFGSPLADLVEDGERLGARLFVVQQGNGGHRIIL